MFQIRRSVWGSFAALLLASLAQAGSECSQPWQRVAESAPTGDQIAYDEGRRRTVLVTGTDTWEWDGCSWRLATQSGPPERGSGALVYDPVGRRVLLFGGYSGSSVRSDLWSWDGSTWMLLSDGAVPGRGDFAMCFDRDRNRLVVHGGYDRSSLLQDTCEWDAATNTWSRFASGPIGRLYAHRMVYDEVRHRAVLHGGFYYYNRGDTWTWDGANWSRIATGGPARYVFCMAFDRLRGEVVMHGGTTCCYEVEYSETFRLRDGSWQLCRNDGPARGYTNMAYDALRDTLVFSGGLGPAPGGRVVLPETWEMSLGQGAATVPCVCPTDLDRDGDTGGGDIGLLMLSYANDDPSLDIDRDGVIDIGDLSSILLAWGPCGG